MTNSTCDRRIVEVRQFNRFFTRRIGVLRERLLDSPFSLTEARVLYELAQRKATTASELSNELALDPGYLSRILRNFGKQGLIEKRPSPTDGRQSVLSLTAAGAAAFDLINSHSQQEVGNLLSPLSNEEQERLVKAMRTITALLGPQPARKVPYLLRPHQPGDMGWVVQRHGALYAAEYGWDERFEALVARIVADFIDQFDPKRERCWIAERDGENVGSVFLVKQSEAVAKLRLLLVEPTARGLGIGGRLVDECTRFARHAGYSKITLWTNSVLLAARHIYQQAGFTLVHSEPHHSFGHHLVGETWEMPV
jgi:DNA-binding MarR family transcriptional regulator/GNAT superfamily N-acetyltransferase